MAWDGRKDDLVHGNWPQPPDEYYISSHRPFGCFPHEHQTTSRAPPSATPDYQSRSAPHPHSRKVSRNSEAKVFPRVLKSIDAILVHIEVCGEARERLSCDFSRGAHYRLGSKSQHHPTGSFG